MATTLFTGSPARNAGYQTPQVLARSVAYDTPGIGTADTIILGTLPSGAQIMSCLVRVAAAFNAATTNVLTVGTASGSDADIVAAGDVDETLAGTAVIYRGCDVTISADTTVYVKYTQTGTAATAGAASIVLTYCIPSN